MSSRFLAVVLLCSLAMPSAAWCLGSDARADRLACCPPGSPDEPLHMRGCCAADETVPASSAPLTPTVLRAAMTVCGTVVPTTIVSRPDRTMGTSRTASVSVRLLNAVFLI